MHEAKDSRLQKKRMNSPWRQCNWITIVIQRATNVGLPILFLFKGGFSPSSPTLFLNLNVKAPLATLKRDHWQPPVQMSGSNRFCSFLCCHVTMPQAQFAFAAVMGPVSFLPGVKLASAEKVGCIVSKKRAYLFHLLSCKIFFKATSPRSTQSNPKAFPWKSS